MKKLDIVSHLPKTSISFRQEDSTDAGTLILSGINNYGVESINVISGINPAHPFTAIDFGSKELVLTNDRHSITLGKDASLSSISLLQFAENKPFRMNFGTTYLNGETIVGDVFDLYYKTGYLNLDVRPFVNGTGVSLVGQEHGIFLSKFTHNNTNMNNNTYYFSDLGSLGASTASSQRRSTLMQKCQARYATWSTYTVTAKENDSTNDFSTGYFINNTTNVSGIITTQLRHSDNQTLAVFTGAINPPVDINFGDQVQIALMVPNYETGMSGVNNSVDVTFFY